MTTMKKRNANANPTPAPQSRWRVPYTAPGSKGGTLTVTATNRSAAVEKVTDILMRRRPSALRSGTGTKTLSLSTRERAQIQFGEPVDLGPVTR